MATPPPRRYEPEELLFLAKSPLVKKPIRLPPIEDWMGQAPTRPTTTRSRIEGDVPSNGNGADDAPRGVSNRRPSIFSESRLSRSSIPEDIILGPPKMSFTSSSAARASSGKFDHDSPRTASLTSPAFEDDRGDGPQFQRFKGFGGFGRGEDKDREPGSRDFSDLRGGFSKRRDDTEGSGWTNVSRQPRKSFGADDGGDRERFRKELRGEGEKKGTPWDRDRPAKYENFGKERERGDRDRDHRGRGKRDESSWLLDDHRGERTRDNHREHNRFGGRVEKDPEWMDSDGKSGDGKAAHSMEDFQKWKERMKASAAATESPKKAEEPVEKDPELEKGPEFQSESRPVERFVEGKPSTQDVPARQTNSPGEDMDTGAGVSLGRDVDRDHHARHISQSHKVEHDSEPQQSTENGVDRFFGFWSGNTILKSPEQGDILSGPRVEPRVGKSRFTSFFGPQESQSPPLPSQLKEQHHMPVNRTPPYTQSPTHETANEDREGFQRILKMLGGTNLNGSDSNPLPATGLLSRPPQSNTAPASMTAHQPPPPPQPQHNLHHLSSPPARDSNTDFFMRLMRGEPQQQQAQQQQAQQQQAQQQQAQQQQAQQQQAQQQQAQQQQAQQQQQQQQQQQHASAPMQNKYGGPSQMPPPPPIDTSILHFNRGNHTISPSLEDPTIAMFRHRPNQESSPIHAHSRGPHIMDHHGPPPGWNPQPVSQAPPPQSLRQVAPPPGFTRAQHHQQGPPPPPTFLPPPGVNGPPVPFQLLNGLNGPLPPNMPPPPHLFMGGMNGMGGINGMNGMNGGPPPLPGSNMNGPPPQGGFPMQFPPHHHPDAMLGAIHGGPPFGFPHHDALKSPPFSHGPPNKGIMR